MKEPPGGGMKVYLYQLKFQGAVHFGTTGIGLERTLDRLSSDSLTSALINAFSIVGEVDSLVDALREEEPPFVLSSLFPFGPCEKSGRPLYALPRPLVNPPVDQKDILRQFGKDLKRTRYLLPEDLAAWLGEAPLSRGSLESILERSKKLAVRWSRDSETGWWDRELRPRVALDRVSRNSSIWFCDALHFHRDAGLYGLIAFKDENWKNGIMSAFRMLGDLGLGGERTYGMGRFEVSGFQPVDQLWPKATKIRGGRYVLLSSYYPSDYEKLNMPGILEAWDFRETRGYVVSGRMATNLKRKTARLIVDGSVVKIPVKGTMLDVTPDDCQSLGLSHRIYRSGLAFLWPAGGGA